eukprot:1147069-Pyramimonas_sp.AAC.1
MAGKAWCDRCHGQGRNCDPPLPCGKKRRLEPPRPRYNSAAFRRRRDSNSFGSRRRGAFLNASAGSTR